jgi:hypothetical protein
MENLLTRDSSGALGVASRNSKNLGILALFLSGWRCYNSLVKMILKICFGLLAAAYFIHCAASPLDWHFIDGVNLIFHEAGHWLFSLFGIFLEILGGSINQVLIPLIIAGYFFLHRQYYSGSVTLMWAGQSLMNVSVYAGDAIKMQLPLLGGDSSIHDWNWLLIYLGQLRHAPQVAAGLAAAGWTIIVSAILYITWTLYKEGARKDYQDAK